MTTKAHRSRLAAFVGVGALALAAVATVVAPAAFADTPGGNVPSGPYNLTITKLENPASGGLVTDGAQHTVPGAVPISGVHYSIAKVSAIDLSDPDDWTFAATLKVNAVGQVVDDQNGVYMTGAATALSATDGNGVTTYSTSTAGLYLVTETSAPGATEVGAPFLVELPLPHTDTNGWLTNVYAYPKNTVLGAPTKSVDDAGAMALGDKGHWTVLATVPNLTPGNPFTVYSLTDTLDSRLTTTPADITVSLKDIGGSAVTLAPTDYTITVNGQVVTVDFTASGLAVLAATPSGTITWGIGTVVTGVGDGTIPNTATQSVQTKHQSDTGVPPTTQETNTVYSTWGDITLHKTDPNGIDLRGAQFKVYPTANDAQNDTNAISIDGVDTFTSDASGMVNIDGLKSQVDGQGANLDYYVVETQAPAGFVIAPAFAASNQGQKVTVLPGQAANATIQVVDPQAPGIDLPTTGSAGTDLIIASGVAGLAVIGIAGLVVVIRRRRSETA